MGLKSFLQKIGWIKSQDATPTIVESPVRPVDVQTVVAEPVITEVKAEEPTKVMVERLVEVAEKKEESKVTARDIKAKSKKVQKPVEAKKPQAKPQAKKPNHPNQPKKPAQKQNQKPAPKKSN